MSQGKVTGQLGNSPQKCQKNDAKRYGCSEDVTPSQKNGMPDLGTNEAILTIGRPTSGLFYKRRRHA